MCLGPLVHGGRTVSPPSAQEERERARGGVAGGGGAGRHSLPEQLARDIKNPQTPPAAAAAAAALGLRLDPSQGPRSLGYPALRRAPRSGGDAGEEFGVGVGMGSWGRWGWGGGGS